MGSVPLIKKEKLEPSISTAWGHSKKTASRKLGSGPAPEIQSVGTLILDFPASRKLRNKRLLFKPPYFGILLQQPEMTEIDPQNLNQSHIS